VATTLVTGCAGFIGSQLSLRLLRRGDHVVGIDNMNAYYDVGLKEARLDRLRDHPAFTFERIDVAASEPLHVAFTAAQPDAVAHLAAQAGVRHSLEHPEAYVSSNLQGFANVLEACRAHPVKHLVYASSSSVYGTNERQPFSEHDNVDHPISLYAASKKSNELMAHAYSHLFGLPTTGLRFFTVYGPWGRPDMAMFLFTRAMLAGEPIRLFNRGDMERDWTYIDDIVEGIVRVLDRPAQPDPSWSPADPDPASSRAPYRLYNIGSQSPADLELVVGLLERNLGVKARRELLPMQPGDVASTCADVSDLERDVGYRPTTRLEDGVRSFVRWYLEYYGRPDSRP